MKVALLALLAGAGMESSSLGVVNTSIVFQVSLDGINWSSSVEAFNGQPTVNVYARALVTYTGTAAPVGLASFVFQPTISHARPGDAVLPFVNGGIGGNTTTPVGVISGSQLTDTTSFGRVSPWGRTATSSTNLLRGIFNSNPLGDGVDYLRIAQTQATSWIGGPGNTTGGSGVPIAQLSDVGRTTADPAFNPSLQNIYVFKFGLAIASGGGQLVQMDIDAPAAGFGNRNSTTGDREVYWFASMVEATGSIRGTASVTPARIFAFVPAPGALGAPGVLGAGMLAVRRRRQR